MSSTLNLNKCIISNKYHKNLLLVKYDNKIRFKCDEKYKNRLMTLINYILKNQNLDIDLNKIKFYKDLNKENINYTINTNNYRKLLNIYNIHELSLLLKNKDLYNKETLYNENKIISNLIFIMSEWI